MVIFILIFVLFVRKFLFWDAFGNFFFVFFPSYTFFVRLLNLWCFFSLATYVFFFHFKFCYLENNWRWLYACALLFSFFFHLDAIELHLTQYLDIIDWNFKCLEFQYESHISRNLYILRGRNNFDWYFIEREHRFGVRVAYFSSFFFSIHLKS